MAADNNLDELERRACNGEAKAFGELIRHYDPDLRGVAWSLVRNQTAVDDIMQDSYEKAFMAIKDFARKSSLKTWLHSICYRTAIDHIRHSSYRRHEQINEATNTPSSQSTSGSALAKTALSNAMNHLEPQQRALLMLTAGMGYSYDEVSAITGLNRGTVASKIGRTRQRLKDLQL